MITFLSFKIDDYLHSYQQAPKFHIIGYTKDVENGKTVYNEHRLHIKKSREC